MGRRPYNNPPVEIPKNVSVDPKGYVYLNVDSSIRLSSDGTRSYSDHKKMIIGRVIDPTAPDWKIDRRMIPNNNYLRMLSEQEQERNVNDLQTEDFYSDVQKYDRFRGEQLPHHDHMSVGLFVAFNVLATTTGLMQDLVDVFGDYIAYFILDLAMYMVSEENAVFQHFPRWARDHATFLKRIPGDSEISVLLSQKITVSKINQFKKKWAIRAVEDGKLYFCYDSTNVNSQADGVFLVQKGHAKDDPSLEQVNTDYVVRESDGLPVTFSDFPGSITDMKEAGEMIEFLNDLLEIENADKDDVMKLVITLICDRGYISEDNVRSLDDAGIGFLMMLRRNMGITETVLKENVENVRRSENYIEKLDVFALTVEGHLFEGDTKTRYFHIIRDLTLEKSHRADLFRKINSKETALAKIIQRKQRLTPDEINQYSKFFTLNVTVSGELEVKKKGRGSGTKMVDAYIVNSAERNHDNITALEHLCGYMVLVSSEKMTASEALDAYSKRDCVEKVFLSLKSHLGMDKYGVHSDDAIHGKSQIWFCASIIYALLKNKTAPLREMNRKSYTTPCVIGFLEEIVADRNLNTDKYERRYKVTKKQADVLEKLSITLKEIDSVVKQLTVE